MTEQETIDRVQSIFMAVKSLSCVSEIDALIKSEEFLFNNKMDERSYPKLQFMISEEEIQTLKSQNILNDNYDLTPDNENIGKDPLVKLLYAILWKNGDLKKVRHVAKGIVDKDLDEQLEAGIVFNQFGRYLTKTKGEPIIDQHVLRAFGIYKYPDDAAYYQKMSVVTKKDLSLIKEYKKWLGSDGLSDKLRSEPEYSFHLDKLLFALGKSVKVRKGKGGAIN